MQGNGGTVSSADRRRACGRDGDVRAGLGRDRRRGDGDAGGRAAGRVRQRRHLRHGRHLERRRPGARRPAGGLERPRARVRDADPRADDRRPHHRRRRRLDRLGRRVRHAARRPGERRRRRRARSATAAAARGRRSPTPTSSSAGSTRSGCWPSSRGVSMAAIARGARCEHVGAPLGLDATAAAAAIVRVANDQMAGAIRMVSLARGHDPRDFALFAFGGAGPLHAAALARELGIPKVLIPARPGLTNALGCLVADLRHDFVATVNQPLEALDPGRVGARVRGADRRRPGACSSARTWPIERIVTLHRADMQFQGQSHILPVAIASTAITIDDAARRLRRRLLEALRRRAAGDPAGAGEPAHRGDRQAPAGVAGAPSPRRRRRRRWPRRGGRRGRCGSTGGWHATPVYVREHLPRACALRRAGDRRAARLHDGDRAGRTGSRWIRSAT